ncbi:MAG: N-acetyltransferase [Burkholderiales bacterium]|nr:MAG: N-acetyltransferase [Betaproteobacteria bacterium]TAG83392.1 MAG: N-acetyltransferase [Burkholderiales bacterium]
MALDIEPLFTATPEFVTPRLVLRAYTAADLEALRAVNEDPEVTQYLPYSTWKTLEDAHAWQARLEKRAAAREGMQFAIRIQASGELLGTALLFGFNIDHEVAEIGYVIGRAHWGKGYVVEAMQPLIDFAFDRMGCHRLGAKLDVRNRASARVLEKLGFAYEGTARDDWFKDGVRSGTAFYGLLRHERLSGVVRDNG